MDEEESFAGVSVITVHEYLFGVQLRHDSEKSRIGDMLASAENDLRRFEVLPLTEDVMDISSAIHAQLTRSGRQIGINDIFIGSTAIRYGLTLVTRNSAHFEKIPKLRLQTY